MSDCIYITSSRGGEGATTVSLYLGLALAESGERTLVLDGDCDCASAMQVSGLNGLSVYTLADAQKGACRVKQAMIRHPLSPNLYLLPTLGCNDGIFVENAVNECCGQFDRVLCDGAAAGACNRAVLVTGPYPSSLASAKKRAASLSDGGFKEVALIVNKVNGGLVFDGAVLTPQETATIIRLPLLGVIPEDLSMPLGKIKPSSRRAFEMTCKRLLGREEKVYGVIKPYTGVTGMIKRKLRSRI